MTFTFTDKPTHVQKMQLVTRFDRGRNIADKSFQCATFSENSSKNISAVDLRHPARGQFEIAVRHALGESFDNYTSPAFGAWFSNDTLISVGNRSREVADP